jgi:hypothetical protein
MDGGILRYRCLKVLSSSNSILVCELQPVTIQPKPSQENQPVETSFLDKIEINKSDLSDEELKRGKDLILVTGCSSHITALGGIVMVLVVTLEGCIVI